MEVKGKKFLVIGAARTGIAAVEYLAGHGAEKVILSDNKAEEACLDKAAREALQCYDNVLFAFGRAPLEREVLTSDMLILSPSVKPSVPAVQLAKQNNIKVMTEIEFAFLFAKAPVIAITGTNGKTTTTSLTGEIFKAAGIETRVAGNIGYPFIACVDELDEQGAFVLEISSYQLELCTLLRPKVATITNITPDHIDRHGTFEEYTNVKYKVAGNQHESDTLVLNDDDELTRQAKKHTKAKCVYFSTEHKVHNGGYYNKEDGNLYIVRDGKEVLLLNRREMKMPGMHNVANALCAAVCAYAFHIAPSVIGDTIRNFKGVEHRIEYVATIDGVDYINDSKGTNTDATSMALKAMEKPVVLLLGGYDKDSQFDDLIEYIKEKTSHIIVLGATKEKIVAMLDKYGYASYTVVERFDDAIAAAKKVARPGEVVLLSPACASWDMFSSFEERGDLFKKIVNEELK